jgi:[ribosomal protein S18]-alanine N-acetyltransferase
MVELKPRIEYQIRPMEEVDISQTLVIDREAFPTQWPFPTYSSFKQELRNKIARYVVAVRPLENGILGNGASQNDPSKKSNGALDFLKKIFNQAKSEPEQKKLEQEVVGFAGFWLMLREVHITTIAVREKYRRLGIGEQLLLNMMDSAKQLNAEILTLEVRITNTKAQQLYRKFGFIDSGIRRSYYTDNNEDALIMTTEKLDNEKFLDYIEQLRKEHIQKWGL